MDKMQNKTKTVETELGLNVKTWKKIVTTTEFLKKSYAFDLNAIELKNP